MFRSCERAEEMLPGPDLRRARDWRPCANIVNTHVVCAGDTGPRKHLPGPVLPAQSLLLLLCVACGRSSRLFRPLPVQMRLQTLFVVQICRACRGSDLDQFLSRKNTKNSSLLDDLSCQNAH